jgi:hypothetical protein
MTAAELAAILDPEHQQKYWWTYYKDWIYYGPPDLHTAREHAWRMEEWLEKKSYGTVRALGITQVFKACGCPENDVLVEENTDHTAALVAAVERIAHNG